MRGKVLSAFSYITKRIVKKTLKIESKLKSSSTTNCKFVKAHLQHILSPIPSESLTLVFCILSWNLVARIFNVGAPVILDGFRIVPWAKCFPISAHQNVSSGDFPGGPVVKTSCFQCRWHKFDPWWETKIPYARAVWPKKKKSSHMYA